MDSDLIVCTAVIPHVQHMEYVCGLFVSRLITACHYHTLLRGEFT